jgi:hypothetical protein
MTDSAPAPEHGDTPMTDSAPAAERSPDERPRGFTGAVIVALTPEAAERERAAQVRARGLTEVNAFLHERGYPPLKPLVPNDESLDAIAALEREAEELQGLDGPLAEPRSLTWYFRVDARVHGEQAQALVDDLLDRDDVKSAYREMTAHDPFVRTVHNPLNLRQRYLNRSPHGINARWMWRRPNGTGIGKGVTVADVEEAWNRSHEDLVAKGTTLVFGDNRRNAQPPATGNHGTSVLGVLVAEDNLLGGVGIAPGVTSVLIASRFRLQDHTDTNVAAAIAMAAAKLSPGDVLLVEVERKDGLPTEVEEADFVAIKKATGAGRVVVTAAGNGGIPLDTHAVGGKFVFDRSSCDFLESGAIMVGAARAKPPHDALQMNTGSRVDCYAYGELVTTAGKGDLTTGQVNPDRRYTGEFGGTSAAAAIVAGAAILVQGRYKALHPGSSLNSLEMRDILSKTGTPQGAGGHIGVMPDLRAIVAANPSLQ